MKSSNLYIVFISISFVFLIGCSSSQFITYRPAGSTEKNWDIHVQKTYGVNVSFQVIINDSTLIDASQNIFTKSLGAKSKYRDKEIKLSVNYSSGFLGIGSGYHAILLIDNELQGSLIFR